MDTETLIPLVGIVIVAALLVKAGFERLRLPPLIGYIFIGFCLRAADTHWGLLPDDAESVFGFFAKLGVITLLFTVGLKSHPGKLVRRLKSAGLVWLGNVIMSGLIGFWAASFLGFDFIPCLIAGVALTATSVGIPSAIWERTGAIETDDGQFFVEVAEMDDVSGILLLTILFGLLPVLRDGVGESAGLAWMTLRTVGWVLLKLTLFGAACFLFARYAETPVVRFFSRSETKTDAVISCTSLAILIAGLADLLGFSVAIGAFFAGLAFSRNREVVENQTPYNTLCDLFVPFFFIGIGLSVPPSTLDQALIPGLLLLVAAVTGKLLGTLPVAAVIRGMGMGGAITLGVSLIPRAEISMIIMERAHRIGDWAVPGELFSAMVVVVLSTCLITPPLLVWLIRRYAK
ncbi:cation:proton antiporter [Kineobactrum sediminis]|uniref:Cation:proton antiporter n=1 Tax=Kineobactrum sediminis TaxID=1905677 RepID=A0A2N5XYP5_9GAMM|nr:cation:proton antiporter [Kineobactrum sediminis]PLW81265.1 cation:proton antiporter [Kineobactrum sediminis]